MLSIRRSLANRTSWPLQNQASRLPVTLDVAARRYRGGGVRYRNQRRAMDRVASLVPNDQSHRFGKSVPGPATKRSDVKYSMFERLTESELSQVIGELGKQPRKYQAWGLEDRQALGKVVNSFITELEASFQQARNSVVREGLFATLQDAYIRGDKRELRYKLEHELTSHAISRQFTKIDVDNQRALADLKYPHEWFPATRAMRRKIHLHVGPTNSGKTYNALKRLESAKSGIYAGPLRLLAHEIYSRLNASGRLCALITGEERRIPEEMTDYLSSCTVEMCPINRDVDVAVIDEIQMIGDPHRGWAWTQAFLGVKAREVHLCGELRTIDLIKQICALTGDDLEIHEYKRLSPLQTSKTSIERNLSKLEKGDALITFSRLEIHMKKKQIEQATGRRCAVVYGSLPPDVRAQQAALFNDPDNEYDFIVASDAIGMGLNLSVKRVIFTSVEKNNGVDFVQLTTPEIKQIGGRAGRYKVPLLKKPGTDGKVEEEKSKDSPKSEAASSVGMVTTLDPRDLHLVRKSMDREVGPLRTAGVFPPNSVLTKFAAYFPPTIPFSYILTRLHDIAQISPLYHLCRLEDQIAISDVIQEFKLTTADRLIICVAPATLRDQGTPAALKAFARCVSEGRGGELLAIKEVDLELLEINDEGLSIRYLQRLESLHKVLTLYLWLSYRFAGVFTSQTLALHVLKLVEAKIQTCLEAIKYTEDSATALEDRKSQQKERAKLRRQMAQVRQESSNEGDVEAEGTTAPEPTDNDDNFGEELEALSDADLELDAEVPSAPGPPTIRMVNVGGGKLDTLERAAIKDELRRGSNAA